VRADGVLARTGSKVVKNVAGFDLPKLLTGSMGTLGLIATATFRLHPLPEEESTMLRPGLGAAAVRAFLADAKRAQLEPASVAAFWRGEDHFDLAVRFEGFRAGLTEQRDRLARLPGQSGSFETLGPEEARDFWSRHDALRSELPVRARLAAGATDLETIAARVLPPLAAAFEEPGFLTYPSLGLSFFSGRPAEAKSAARALAGSRAAVEKLGGSLTLSAATGEIRELVDVWGTPPPALPLMRSVKQRLDPQRIFAPGRFVGGI
jgi:glycolate oxidase FAD binding subunit